MFYLNQFNLLKYLGNYLKNIVFRKYLKNFIKLKNILFNIKDFFFKSKHKTFDLLNKIVYKSIILVIFYKKLLIVIINCKLYQKQKHLNFVKLSYERQEKYN